MLSKKKYMLSVNWCLVLQLFKCHWYHFPYMHFPIQFSLGANKLWPVCLLLVVLYVKIITLMNSLCVGLNLSFILLQDWPDHSEDYSADMFHTLSYFKLWLELNFTPRRSSDRSGGIAAWWRLCLFPATWCVLQFILLLIRLAISCHSTIGVRKGILVWFSLVSLASFLIYLTKGKGADIPVWWTSRCHWKWLSTQSRKNRFSNISTDFLRNFYYCIIYE